MGAASPDGAAGFQCSPETRQPRWQIHPPVRGRPIRHVEEQAQLLRSDKKSYFKAPGPSKIPWSMYVEMQDPSFLKSPIYRVWPYSFLIVLLVPIGSDSQKCPLAPYHERSKRVRRPFYHRWSMAADPLEVDRRLFQFSAVASLPSSVFWLGLSGASQTHS